MKKFFIPFLFLFLISQSVLANKTPVAQNFDVGVITNTPILIDMSKFVFDLDSDILSITILSDSSILKGNATVSGMEISYTPESNFTGTQYIKYQVCDQDKACGFGTIIVSINSVGKINNPPYANYFGFGIKKNTPTIIDFSKNSTDPDGDSLTINIVLQPDNGTIKLVGKDFVYTPDSNIIGEDVIVYQVCDPYNACKGATIDLYINSNGKINQAPIAKDFNVGVKVNTATILEVSKNASDLDGDILITTIEGAPAYGTAVVSGKNISYKPDSNFVGEDVVFYQVCDSSNGCAVGMISISVSTSGKINQYPIAKPFSVGVKTNSATLIEISKNSSDPDGDVLTTKIDSTTINGTASVIGKEINYTPKKDFIGEDYLTYQVCDPFNACSYASVTITVNANGKFNQGPLVKDFSVGVNTNTLTTLEVSKSTSDPDGDILTTTILNGSLNGSAIVSGKEITYTPNKDYTGVDFVTYQVCDPSNVCNSAKITISVNSAGTINQIPVVNSFDIGVKTNTATSLDVSKNSSDADGDMLTTSIITAPAKGIAVVVGKEILYTPTKDFAGSDNIVYQVCDLYNDCGVANISITVNALGKINQWPVSKEVTTTVKSNVITIIDLTSYISDPDNDALTISIDEEPIYGTATVDDTKINYTPLNGTVKSDTLGIRVCDMFNACAFSNIIITIALSVEELNPVTSNIKVYPNPFTNELSLSYTLNENSDVKVELSSILGSTLSETNYKNQQKGSHKIDLGNQLNQTGIYYLSLTVNNKRYTTKVVKVE